ncbi:MAG: hypothetical protein HZB33_07940 [Nitrospirae bacterium]|nr:hypothetical protein [Nitrospirota bacterium]
MNKFIICACFCLLILTVASSAMSDVMASDAQNLIKLFEGPRTAKYEERRNMIKKVKEGKLQVSGEIKKLLIDRFEKASNLQEAYVEKLGKQGISEGKATDRFYEEYGGQEYAQFYGDFAALVAAFKDTRAIQSLLKGLYYYGGNVLPTEVISTGENAVEPLISETKSRNKLLRRMAFFVLSVWANAPVAYQDYSIGEELAIKNITQLNDLKEIFLKALSDEEKDIRLSAAYGLGVFPEAAVIQKLEEVVSSDSYQTKYSKQYIVRDEAARTITRLKKKMASDDASK